ncbi:hypothetical protein MASR2M48_34360 [Spirochaetota bacterium]
MLASKSGVPFDIMKLGNPELRYGITPPEGRYSLKVPTIYEASVKEVIASRETLMNVYMHIVRSGDTVSALAKHYEVSVAMIARMNSGLKPDHTAGQKITPHSRQPRLAQRINIDHELSFAGSYTVLKGDTLWSISLQYGVQPEVLAAKNGLSLLSVLREGLSLAVPIPRGNEYL